jgi:hypothetical protein
VTHSYSARRPALQPPSPHCSRWGTIGGMRFLGNRCLWTLSVGLLPFAAISCAKPPNFPEFKGHVVDQAGKPVPGAIVKLVKIENDPIVSAAIDYAETDGNGDFDFSETDLKDGKKFVIVVNKRGFDSDAQEVSLWESPKERDVFVLKESVKK